MILTKQINFCDPYIPHLFNLDTYSQKNLTGAEKLEKGQRRVAAKHLTAPSQLFNFMIFQKKPFLKVNM